MTEVVQPGLQQGLQPGLQQGLQPGWGGLRALTAARIGLVRSGASLGTAALLEFRLAHARARDAVHEAMDAGAVVASLPCSAVLVRSRVGSRREYLMRPDLGRVLDADAAGVLGTIQGAFDLVVVIGDGLSARAVERHAGAVLRALLPALGGWRVAPAVVVEGSRVAVGDAVAGVLGAGAVLVLIGERPGLSAPDSLGAYLTWRPRPGGTDADRNCVSNIRPEGLGYEEAAHRIWHLLVRMREIGRSGVGLKDESSGAGPGVTGPGGSSAPRG